MTHSNLENRGRQLISEITEHMLHVVTTLSASKEKDGFVTGSEIRNASGLVFKCEGDKGHAGYTPWHCLFDLEREGKVESLKRGRDRYWKTTQTPP